MKKGIYIAAIIAFLLIIHGLLGSIVDLWSKQDLIIKARQNLAREKKDNQDLKGRLTYVQSREFIETEARNKLFMVKPGESEVLIQQNLIAKGTKEAQKPHLEPWQQWLALFSQ